MYDLGANIAQKVESPYSFRWIDKWPESNLCARPQNHRLTATPRVGCGVTGESALARFLSGFRVSIKIKIVKVTGINYWRSLSHAKRLHRSGTHQWDGLILRERDPHRLHMHDRHPPYTAQPPKFLPFNYPLPYEYLKQGVGVVDRRGSRDRTSR
jgi:hypothetical protein